eukprot:Rhum_TRINITY_DN16841_c0_g1::Rhum_TRINITY_DN16841_c0_g1_i1::g.164615::m.164615
MTTTREELIAKTTQVQRAAKVAHDCIWNDPVLLAPEVLRVMRETRVHDDDAASDEFPLWFGQTKRNFNTLVDSELFRRQLGSKAIHGMLREADVVAGVQPEYRSLVDSLAATLDVRFSNCLHSFFRHLRERLRYETGRLLVCGNLGVSPGELCQGLWRCLRDSVHVASRHSPDKEDGAADAMYHVAKTFQKTAINALTPALQKTLPATYFAAGLNEQGIGLHSVHSDVLLQNHELSLLFSLVYYGGVVDALRDECKRDQHAIPLVETQLYQHTERCSLELFAMLDPTRAIVELVRAPLPQPDACVDAEHEVLPHGAEVFVDGLQRHLFERVHGNHALCAAAHVFQTPEQAMRQYNRVREDEATLQANVALVKEEWQGFSARVFNAFEAAVHSSNEGAAPSVVLLLWKSHTSFDPNSMVAQTAEHALDVKGLLLDPSWEGSVSDATERLRDAVTIARLLQCVYAACKLPSLVGENPEPHSFPGLLLQTSLLLHSLEAAKAAFTEYREFVRSICRAPAQPQPGVAPRTAALTAFLSLQEMADFRQRMTGDDTDGDQTMFSVIRYEVQLMQMIGIRPLRRNLLLLVDLCMLRCFIHPQDGCGGDRLAYSDCSEGFTCPDVYARASSAGSRYHRSRVAALLYREFSAKLYDLHNQQSLANTSLAALPEQMRTSAALLCANETAGSAADAPILPLLDVFCRTDDELKETLDRLGSALAATRADASAAAPLVPSSCAPQRQAFFAEGTHVAFQTPIGGCAEGSVCGVLRRAVTPRSDGVPQPSPALYSYIVRRSSPQRCTTVVSEQNVVSSRERDAHVPSLQTALFTPASLHGTAVSARPPATAHRAGDSASSLPFPAGPRGTCRGFDSDTSAAAKKRKLVAHVCTPAQWNLEDWEPVPVRGTSTSGTPPSSPVEGCERKLQASPLADELSPPGTSCTSTSVLPDTSTPIVTPTLPAKLASPEWQPKRSVAAPSSTPDSPLDSQQALVVPATPPAQVLSSDAWRTKYEAAMAKHTSELMKHKKLLAFATAKWGERAALLDKVLVLQLGYAKVATDLERLGRVVPERSDLVAALHTAAPRDFLAYATPVHVPGHFSQTAWQEKYAEAKAMFKSERARHKELHAKVCLVQSHLSQLTREEAALVRATIANKKLYDHLVE